VLTCPHCKKHIRIQELSHPGLFKNYRTCTSCGGKFTPDIHTKYLQAICILLAIVSLGITLLLFFDGTSWLVPAIITYLILAALIFWGNKRMFLVAYENGN